LKSNENGRYAVNFSVAHELIKISDQLVVSPLVHMQSGPLYQHDSFFNYSSCDMKRKLLNVIKCIPLSN
jgi:hypothetical protein